MLLIIFHWDSERLIENSINTLDLNYKSIVDWFNVCRNVCFVTNINGHNRLLGYEHGLWQNNSTPNTVIQNNESLLRGKRMYNRGGLLLGKANLSENDRIEWESLNVEENMDLVRNYGRKMTGQWIFGVAECKKNFDESYTTDEVRLFVVDIRDSDTLIPHIRNNCKPGSAVWSDQSAAYNQIGNCDGLIHESVNHTEHFFTDGGVHTQNIEINTG